MSAYAAPIEVVQAALHRIGEDTIDSLDDGSSAAAIANSNYEGIVRAYFAKHAWTFATQTLDLTRVGAVTLGGWTNAYTWSAEVLNIRYVMIAGRRLRTNEYAIENGQVLTAVDETIQIVATVRAIESVWPGDFSEAVVVRMQGLFLEGLCDKWQDARLKIKDADEQIKAAITRDKRQTPGVSAQVAPLAETWRVRGRRAAQVG